MKKLLLITALLSVSLSLSGQNLIKAALPEYWENPTGPYKVAVNDKLDNLAKHTIFYPEDLSAFPEKDKLPVLVMSGPGADQTSSAFRAFFTEVASHGYLFIVCGVLTEETVNTGILPKNTKQDYLDALDWVYAENYRPGSIFYGKIDLKNICAMGQSAGGIQALDIMNDPRITLLTLFNSGLFKAGQSPMGGGRAPMGGGQAPAVRGAGAPAAGGPMSMGDVMNVPKDRTFAKLRVPIAYFVGGTDMARTNAEDDFNYIEGVPALLCVRDIPGDAHAGTFREMNGGAFAEGAIPWLDWQMKGNEEASLVFKGAPCPLEASSTKWISVRKKNIDFVKDKATDWPDFMRYEDQNASLEQAPDVVLMGDSITDYWVEADPAFFENNNFAGRGIAGQTVSQMLVRFKQDVIDLHPKAVVINGGTNDLCQQMAGMAYYPDRTIFDNTVAMCELAEAAGIKVILTSVTPCAHYMPIPTMDAGVRIVELNNKLKEYAESHKGITYVDYFTPMANDQNGLDPDMSFDGVHPKINGYYIMERLLTDGVKKALKSKKDYYVISEADMLAKKALQEEERAAMMSRFTR